MRILTAALLIALSLTNSDVMAGDYDYRGNGVSRLMVSGIDDADSLAHTGSIKSIQYALYDAVIQSGRKIEKPWEVVLLLNLFPFDIVGGDMVFEKGEIEGQSEPVFRIVTTKTLTVRGDVLDRAYKEVLRLERNKEFQNAFEDYSKAMNRRNPGEMSRMFMAFEKLQSLGLFPEFKLNK